MSVQELNEVHRRYIRASNHFKSTWTFHQFVQGLRKVFPEVGPRGDYPTDFQAVYSELKSVSKVLTETTTEEASERLDAIERQLVPLVAGLSAIDDEISPSLLRQFFQRVKNYDDNILSQLVKFYLHGRSHRGWETQRLDKADFLATKLAEEYQERQDQFVLRDRTTVREMCQGLWAALGIEGAPQTEVELLRAQVEEMRLELESTETLEQLHGRQAIERYRDLKHTLADRYFEPRILPEILTTNLAVKNHVHRLYRRDEQRIVAEYQQVFELERDAPIDVQLGEELTDFREEVERFEQQLAGDDVKLAEIAALRRRVRALVPKLSSESRSAPAVLAGAQVEREVAASSSAGGEHDVGAYVAETLQMIVDALDDTNATVDPRRVAVQPEIFSLGISAREVTAYRRLYGGGPCDEGLERVLLTTAALRLRIENEVEEIKGLLDESAVNREAPIFAEARVSCTHADLYARIIGHRQEMAVLGGDIAEARELQTLRMRFLRAYSGLWLMVYR